MISLRGLYFCQKNVFAIWFQDKIDVISTWTVQNELVGIYVPYNYK